MKSSGIGGQAVLEGIMMKNGDRYAVAVRKPDGEIAVDEQEYDAVNRMRNLVSGKKPEESAEVIITEFCKTTTNTEFVHKIEKIHF